MTNDAVFQFIEKESQIYPLIYILYINKGAFNF